METRMTGFAVIVLAVLSGCSSREKQEQNMGLVGVARAQLTERADDPKIGEPCDPQKDGWIRPQLTTEEAADEARARTGKPQFVVPRRSGVIASTKQLPKGTKYCLAGVPYPDGYMTATCRSDANCPDGALCSKGGLCRKSCSADSDCASGSVCTGGQSDRVRFCQCVECIEKAFHRD